MIPNTARIRKWVEIIGQIARETHDPDLEYQELLLIHSSVGLAAMEQAKKLFLSDNWYKEPDIEGGERCVLRVKSGTDGELLAALSQILASVRPIPEDPSTCRLEPWEPDACRLPMVYVSRTGDTIAVAAEDFELIRIELTGPGRGLTGQKDS